MKRRRFLHIAAAAALSGLPEVGAAEVVWRGRGFGADLSLTLTGPGDRATVLAALPRLIAAIEAEFSLYDPASTLSRLNAGERVSVSPALRALLDWSAVLHRVTAGAFDPTGPVLWQKGLGGKAAPIGLARLDLTARTLRLPAGMALTFNGIAQGYAADAVRGLLATHGFAEALVDMGEFAALGGPYRLGLADPLAGLLAERQLTGGAMATSSPFATTLAGQPHIRHPRGLAPRWSTVSIEADQALMADGLSTAAVFLSGAERGAPLPRLPGLRRITTVDFDGNLSSLTA